MQFKKLLVMSLSSLMVMSSVVVVNAEDISQGNVVGVQTEGGCVFPNLDTSIGYVGKVEIPEGYKVQYMVSSNPGVAQISNTGDINVVGGGEATIFIYTDTNVLSFNIKSSVPEIDTTGVSLYNDESYQIEVIRNKSGLPVNYELVEGELSVGQDGVVSGLNSDRAVVSVKIGDTVEYLKVFNMRSHADNKWNEMQPYINECLGTPYVMGGEIPGVALDCSAYVSYVYRSVGLMEGRTTAQGLYDMTNRTLEPKEGDLVFFHSTYDCPDYITHVGIYAGNGMMYHSGEPNQLTSLNNDYWQSHLAGYGTLLN